MYLMVAVLARNASQTSDSHRWWMDQVTHRLWPIVGSRGKGHASVLFLLNKASSGAALTFPSFVAGRTLSKEVVLEALAGIPELAALDL